MGKISTRSTTRTSVASVANKKARKARLAKRNKDGLKAIQKQLQVSTRTFGSIKKELKRNLEGNFKIRCAPESDPLSDVNMQDYSAAYEANPVHQYTANALASVPVSLLAENRAELMKVNYAYSHTMDKCPKATSQDHSGRCWMFAALNAMRYVIIKNFNLNDRFELSEAYLFFYDKLERSHYFLNKMVEFRTEPPTETRLHGMLTYFSPMEDGGTWSFFTNLVNKYGIVPKTCYGENFNSSYSDEMNKIMHNRLIEFVAYIRSTDRTDEQLRAEITDVMMPQLYALMAQFMGEPPKTFDWSYHEVGETFEAVRDKGAYHLVKDLTPQVFFHQYIDNELQTGKKVILRNDPRTTSEFYKSYTVEHFGNMVGGRPDVALNVPIEVLKDAAAQSIMNGRAVWFDCDVGKCMNDDKSLLSTEAFDYEGILNTTLEVSKADGLDLRMSAPTHAMLLVGVDMEDNDTTKINKWRVENSWGEWQSEDDPGYLQMSDKWFQKYVYNVVVDLDLLPQEVQEAYLQNEFNPVVLPYNDAFGAVAAPRCRL